jgi:hypothetical protein
MTVMKLEDFFTNRSVIDYDWKIQGMRIEEEPGRMIFGGRCGPDNHDVASLCHEMAHFVEIDDARCMMRNWGLRYTQVEVFGQLYPQAVTCQGAMREIRVIALQKNLHKTLGVKEYIHKTTRSLEHLHDWCFVPMFDGRSAFGEDADHSLSSKQCDISRLMWCRKQVNELAKKPEFSIDAFIAEWRRKHEIVVNKL